MALATTRNIINTFWQMTKSDILTFVIPNTLFGLIGVLSKPALTTIEDASVSQAFSRLPHVIVFNWLNVLVFELANQRLPDSIKEDGLNKPWRPIPSGLLTPIQMRWLLLLALPCVLITSWSLGAWKETALLFNLTWIYNDLGAGNEDPILRNLVIGIAFGIYNGGSLRVACASECSITSEEFHWIFIISAAITCTMHIQDLQDQVGDRARNRRTIPLVLGDYAARWTVAIMITVWSIICPIFLGLKHASVTIYVVIGALVAYRTVQIRGPSADHISWIYWAGWLVSLYTLPLVKGGMFDTVV